MPKNVTPKYLEDLAKVDPDFERKFDLLEIAKGDKF